MKALVIPSNRADQLDEFFAAWEASGQADWDVVILSEDSETRRMQPRCPWPLHHFAHDDMDERLGDDAWIISKGDSARRCFGFLIACELGAEWILTLDDDCRPWPATGPICAAHLAAMRFTQCQPTAGMRTRGLPYRNLGEIQSLLNMGLWCNVADVDGPAGLLSQPFFTPPTGRQLAHPRARYPLCGMNLFFRADLTPALYFPLMGRGQPFRRFDDIWCGWIFQKLAEHLSIPWSFGEPWIEHVRASDPFANLIKEAPGITANETLWQQVDALKLTAGSLAGAVVELGAGLATSSDSYLSRLGLALETWQRLAGYAASPAHQGD